MFARICATIVLILLGGTCSAQDQIEVLYEDALCLAQNIDAFEAYPNPIIIILSDCRDRPATISEFMTSTTEASGARIAKPREGRGISNAIITTKSKLRCIAAAAERASPDLLIDGRLHVDFDSCR